MPTYTYQCPECGWRGDVRCAIADRDTQRCPNKVDPTSGHDHVCATTLRREEIPADQGRMTYNWSKWQ